MPATTPDNLRYPVDSDTPDVPRDIKNLADDVQAALTADRVAFDKRYGVGFYIAGKFRSTTVPPVTLTTLALEQEIVSGGLTIANEQVYLPFSGYWWLLQANVVIAPPPATSIRAFAGIMAGVTNVGRSSYGFGEDRTQVTSFGRLDITTPVKFTIYQSDSTSKTATGTWALRLMGA
jgi:hypothetical protein